MMELTAIEGEVTAREAIKELPLEQLRELATQDLYIFAKGVLQYSWLVPHIHMPLCRLLENYESNPRLLVELPRGWLKTTIASIAYPLWRAIRNPNLRILICQNTFTNACKKLGNIRDHIERNQLFRTLWPELLPTGRETWKTDALCLRRPGSFSESTFEAAGVRTQIVGRHYDLVIEDDTVAPEFSDMTADNLLPTKDDVEQAIGFHKLLMPILNNASDQILIIGTRWFERDLISYIKSEPALRFKVYSRAVREDENGNPDERGRVTYPERFGPEVLTELQATMGLYLFSCLYMNKPIRSDTMPFKPEWIQYFQVEPKYVDVWTTMDLAGDPKDSKTVDLDYTVVLTCGKDKSTGFVYVLDYWRERAGVGAILDELFAQVDRWKPIKVGCESVALQKMMLYNIRERMQQRGKWFMLEGLTGNGRSKYLRIMGLVPVFQNRSIMMRTHMKELENELKTFPLGAHDDVIDALSMQLEFWPVSDQARLQKPSEETDPYSLEAGLESIRLRRKAENGSEPLVFDLAHSEASLN